MWDRFEQSVGLADNFRVHRLNLISYKQQAMESIDKFYTRCRALAMKCKFGNSLDERIIDQLIIGTRMAESRRELLKGDENLTIDNALNQCRAHEASEAHMKAFEKAGTSRVDAVTRKPRQKQVTDCKFCALDHPFGKCPAYYTKCTRCGQIGHWKSWCKTLNTGKRETEDKRLYYNREEGKKLHGKTNQKRQKEFQLQKKQVHAVDEEQQEAHLSFDAIQSSRREVDGPNNDDVMVRVKVQLPDRTQQAEMTCKVDTGAQGNILPLRTFRKMFPEMLKDGKPTYGSLVREQPFVKLQAYNGSEIRQYGSLNLKLRYGNHANAWHETQFYVAESPGPIILGNGASQRLTIVNINMVHELTLTVQDIRTVSAQPIADTKMLLDLYPDRFKGIGEFPGEYHIDVEQNSSSVVHTSRLYSIHPKAEYSARVGQDGENAGY